MTTIIVLDKHLSQRYIAAHARFKPNPVMSDFLRSRFPAYAALIVTTALWGSNGTVARPLDAAMGPFTLSVLRWVVVLAVLLPFVWSERAAMLCLLRGQLGLMVGFGLLGGALQSGLIYAGLAGSTAIHLGLLNSAIPVLIILISWIWHARRPRALEGAGLAVSLAGVLLILAHGDLVALLHLDFGVGDLLMLAGMVNWAFYTIKLRQRPESLSLFGFAFLLALVGIVLAFPAIVAETILRGPPQLGWSEVASLAYIGLLPTLAGMLLFTYGVERAGPVRAGIFVHFMPVFATVFAVLVLGEAFHAYHALGFVLVAGGALLALSQGQARDAPPAAAGLFQPEGGGKVSASRLVVPDSVPRSAAVNQAQDLNLKE
jgi:drug/metabolite transporter (DMT)-like permease